MVEVVCGEEGVGDVIEVDVGMCHAQVGADGFGNVVGGN